MQISILAQKFDFRPKNKSDLVSVQNIGTKNPIFEINLVFFTKVADKFY